MVNDTDPLEQFHKWYDHTERLPEQTRYSLARDAFFAGHQARPSEPRLASRDALTDERKEEILAKYRPPRTSVTDIEPDYVQHGTITGRIPPRQPAKGLEFREHGRHPLAGPSEETLRRVQDGLAGKPMTLRPLPPTTEREEKAAAHRAAYGGPAETREDTMTFPKISPQTFEHATTVWQSGMAQQLPPLAHFEPEPYVVDGNPGHRGGLRSVPAPEEREDG